MADYIAVGSQRVGDEERQRVAEVLADQHSRGRLNQEQFEERLGAAFAAETTADLGRVLADLPIRAPEPEPDSGGQRWRDSIPSEVRWILAAFAAVLALGFATGLGLWLLSDLFGGVFLWDVLEAFLQNPRYLVVAFVAGLLGLITGLVVGRRRSSPFSRGASGLEDRAG